MDNGGVMSDLIKALVNLATARGLTGQDVRKFERIDFVIDLDEVGDIVHVSSTVAAIRRVRGSEGIEFHETRGKKMPVLVPYILGSENQFTPSDFLWGKAEKWFPATVSGDQSSWPKVWRTVLEAASDDQLKSNPGLAAVAKFVQSRPTKAQLKDRYAAKLKTLGITPGELSSASNKITFRFKGRLLLRDDHIQKWWVKRQNDERESKAMNLQLGRDFWLPDQGPLAEDFPGVFGNTPLQSFNTAPFRSYGTGTEYTWKEGNISRKGKCHAGMRLETAEMAAAALDTLNDDDNHHLSYGKDIRLLFWAVDESSGKPKEADCSFVSFLESPDPLEVRDFFQDVWGHRPPTVSGEFHVLALTTGQGRFKVRSWYSGFLEYAQQNVERFFGALQLHENQERLPSVWELCRCLRPEQKDPRDKADILPHHAAGFLQTALFRHPLPSGLLQPLILRQQVEMAAFDPVFPKCEDRLEWRTSLLRLLFHFNVKDYSMNEANHSDPNHPKAYHCGRLLAVLSLIHEVAHGGPTGSSPANKYYSSASRNPALVFPRLLGSARHHLDKIGNQDRVADRLEFGIPSDDPTKGLTGIAPLVTMFNGSPWAEFPPILRLEEQGRFAIGFYYERCRCDYWRYRFTQPK